MEKRKEKADLEKEFEELKRAAIGYVRLAEIDWHDNIWVIATLLKEKAELEKEKYDLEKKVREQYYEIQQYEKWFANWSWHWDDEY